MTAQAYLLADNLTLAEIESLELLYGTNEDFQDARFIQFQKQADEITERYIAAHFIINCDNVKFT